MIKMYYENHEFPISVTEENELVCIGFCMQCPLDFVHKTSTNDCLEYLADKPCKEYESIEEWRSMQHKELN